MPNPTQVVGDADPFLNQQADIDEKIMLARRSLQTPSLTTVCLECGDEIGAARLKALPSACKCINCAEN